MTDNFGPSITEANIIAKVCMVMGTPIGNKMVICAMMQIRATNMAIKHILVGFNVELLFLLFVFLFILVPPFLMKSVYKMENGMSTLLKWAS